MIEMAAHSNGMIQQSDWLLPQVILAAFFLTGLLLYMIGLFISKRRFSSWPAYRTICWIAGTILALSAVAGPLAGLARSSFLYHMVGHLLLGMLAPLMMAIAAPVTILMRALPVTKARRISRILRSEPVRIISNPVTASLLNVGGLWLIYTTPIYTWMHDYPFLYLLIHIHVFLAGYLFTISLIYTDPVSHRTSYLFRSIVLILALAAHGILSKYLYAHPPAEVPVHEAEGGAMIMYYGGDAIDLILIIILCLHWYKSYKPEYVSSTA